MGWLFGGSSSSNEQKYEVVRADQIREGDYVRKKKVNSWDHGGIYDDFYKVTHTQAQGIAHTRMLFKGYEFPERCENKERFERLL